MDALGLPTIWAKLGRGFGWANYFHRAAQTAVMIADLAMVEWAAQKWIEPRSLSDSAANV